MVASEMEREGLWWWVDGWCLWCGVCYTKPPSSSNLGNTHRLSPVRPPAYANSGMDAYSIQYIHRVTVPYPASMHPTVYHCCNTAITRITRLYWASRCIPGWVRARTLLLFGRLRGVPFRSQPRSCHHHHSSGFVPSQPACPGGGLLERRVVMGRENITCSDGVCMQDT